MCEDVLRARNYGSDGGWSLAGSPKALIKNPDDRFDGRSDDVLSSVLKSIRLSGSLQFCFMPTGAWQTPGRIPLPGTRTTVMPFHVLVQGTCWMQAAGRDWHLDEGDVVALPFDAGHKLGAGTDGNVITPLSDLPPKPWPHPPILRYGKDSSGVRLLCGYLQCDALSFQPLRTALPPVLHVRTKGSNSSPWLRAAIEQMTAEVDTPRSGGLSMLERLTEIVFIELLRHQIIATESRPAGWLAALTDRSLGQCLALIHEDPKRDWNVQDLASACGLSRSVLAERFQAVLDTSPMRYVRDWRLCLAGVALSTTKKSISAIADETGYGTEAAFNRAFARSYGVPPATWRQNAKRDPYVPPGHG